MIKDLLGKQLLFFSGAMGTQLQERGLKTGETPDFWNITRGDVVHDVCAQYLAAGCDIIKTNTFGFNSCGQSDYTVGQITTGAVSIAKKAVHECLAQNPARRAFVALDIGPTGRLLKPLGDLHFEEAYEIFKKMVVAGASAGADLVLIETMSDAYELKASVLAAKENCDLPVIASVTLDEKGKLLTGGGIDVVVTLLEGLGVDAIGLNCGYGHEKLTEHLADLIKLSSVPVLFMPNAGLPESRDGTVKFNTSPEEFAQIMKQSAENGVWLLGGCCGTTPAHIEALVKTCAGVKPPPVTRKQATAACSYGRTVVFGGKPVIIGERINPTGKPKLKQALKDGDYDYVLREGILQAEQGADALDVNAGMPGIDEKEVLSELVGQLQGVLDTPLQIDSADTDALARALRVYNGKPVINSVNGKADSMDAVFPLVKKYGGILVALTLDENGIPETAQGRVDIAKKILGRAKEYGIGKESFLFDALTMAVGAGKSGVAPAGCAGQPALVTLECVRRLKKELGVKTILGVSNVSFGLPCRETLNFAFLSLALEAGLDAAIVNPNVNLNSAPDKTATDALLGKDENFARYIETYGSRPAGTGPKESAAATAGSDIPLNEAILRGLKTRAAQGAKRGLESLAPLELIEKELVPALNMAGLRFENGTMYLPQLLMCAEAAKSAFAVIRGAMGETASDTTGTVIVATVEGDIHDIGKNIVRAMLESYRFHVVDLGKDVPAESVVQAARKHNAGLVGLSALMTTTVVNMEKTIRALREAVPDCKIMCGGAVLTEEYAKSIGADCYVKDAMSSVRYAQNIMKKA
jgi:5-methyltetrahydrofolate--homocysteine methyltransferase